MGVLQPSGSLEDVIKVIEEETSGYENITIIEGFDISSHNAEDYADGFLHPNKEGFGFMAEGIIKKLKQKAFI